ncbi:hypothetical protein DPX16_7558 [Anabarilius grahami]|uniref:Uncharacterized protein n=1 Tax=Anabarilius grahami TaxID=495550 RepID=A0A3N0YQZ8_ANAGA|nr:hypothetical protein DPX16_7558 [Anabarilius grahami]
MPEEVPAQCKVPKDELDKCAQRMRACAGPAGEDTAEKRRMRMLRSVRQDGAQHQQQR